MAKSNPDFANKTDRTLLQNMLESSLRFLDKNANKEKQPTKTASVTRPPPHPTATHTAIS